MEAVRIFQQVFSKSLEGLLEGNQQPIERYLASQRLDSKVKQLLRLLMRLYESQDITWRCLEQVKQFLLMGQLDEALNVCGHFSQPTLVISVREIVEIIRQRNQAQQGFMEQIQFYKMVFRKFQEGIQIREADLQHFVDVPAEHKIQSASISKRILQQSRIADDASMQSLRRANRDLTLLVHRLEEQVNQLEIERMQRMELTRKVEEYEAARVEGLRREEDMKEELLNLRLIIEQQTIKWREVEEQNEGLKQQVEDVKDEKNTLAVEISQFKDNTASKVQEITADRQKLQNHIQKQATHCSQLTQERDSLSRKVIDLQDQVGRLLASVDTLEQSQEQNQHSQRESAQRILLLEEQLSMKQEQISRNKKDLAESKLSRMSGRSNCPSQNQSERTVIEELLEASRRVSEVYHKVSTSGLTARLGSETRSRLSCEGERQSTRRIFEGELMHDYILQIYQIRTEIFQSLSSRWGAIKEGTILAQCGDSSKQPFNQSIGTNNCLLFIALTQEDEIVGGFSRNVGGEQGTQTGFLFSTASGNLQVFSLKRGKTGLSIDDTFLIFGDDQLTVEREGTTLNSLFVNSSENTLHYEGDIRKRLKFLSREELREVNTRMWTVWSLKMEQI